MAYGSVNVPGKLTAEQVGALPVTGGTLSGNLTLKGPNNYGTKINFGDGDYVHISEPTDDCMEIKAKKVNFVLSDTSDEKFTVNGSPVGASPDLTGFVPTTRTVNGKPLSANISLNAANVGARPNTWTPTAADVGAVPTTRTVNGKALSANISLNAADVGAATASAVSQAYDLAMSAITTAIDGIVLGGSVATKNIVRYGVCSEGSSVGNRTVAIPGFQLVEGARISVKFDYQCNVCGPTLNVNGTGAKDILVPNLHGTWENGSIVDFIYDGTRWVIPEGISKLVEQRLGKKLDKSGGSMTGHLYAYDDTGYTTSKVRNISFGTTALTAGSSSLTSGAIKLIYE